MNERLTDIDLHSAGFHMPAEWHPHAATWLAWPHNQETWPKNLPEARDEFWQLAETIAKDEPVCLIANPSSRINNTDLPNWPTGHSNNNIRLIELPTNDAWMRDYGPTFCINSTTQQLAAVDWHYNAWGGKYPPYDADQQITSKILNQLEGKPDCLHIQPKLCLEGGAVEIDSHGTLLCTTSCAMNENRNPNLPAATLIERLQKTLGAKSVIWLPGDSIEGDDTDGHIDQLARFTPSDSILYAWSDASEAQQRKLIDNRDALRQAVDCGSLQKELVPLPLPDPVYFQETRLPASYCNFYITNRSVIVPQFDMPQDLAAIEINQKHFPNHQAIGLPSRHLLVGLGSFHCLTQQQPQLL